MPACLPALQVGDLLDRGDHELPLLFWLERLQRQAAAAGGAIHVLNGEGRLRSWFAAAQLDWDVSSAQAGGRPGKRRLGERLVGNVAVPVVCNPLQAMPSSIPCLQATTKP